jgi:hypothetical protein
MLELSSNSPQLLRALRPAQVAAARTVKAGGPVRTSIPRLSSDVACSVWESEQAFTVLNGGLCCEVRPSKACVAGRGCSSICGVHSGMSTGTLACAQAWESLEQVSNQRSVLEGIIDEPALFATVVGDGIGSV